MVLTVNELSSLSLDVQIQRPVPAWKEQKGCVNIHITKNTLNTSYQDFYYVSVIKWGESPWQSFSLLFCGHITTSG